MENSISFLYKKTLLNLIMYEGWHCVFLWCFVITDKNVKIVKTNMHCFKLFNLNTGNEFFIDT